MVSTLCTPNTSRCWSSYVYSLLSLHITMRGVIDLARLVKPLISEYITHTYGWYRASDELLDKATNVLLP